MNAAPGPPAHEIPVADARATHSREAARLCGPGEPVAEVRDLRVGEVPVRTFRPEGDGPLPDRRLPARRRLDDGHARQLRHADARAGQRLGGDRGRDRLPAVAPSTAFRPRSTTALAAIRWLVAQRRRTGRRRRPAGRGRRQRGRQPGGRGRAAPARRAAAARADPDLPGDRRGVRHRLVPRLRRGPRAQRRLDAALLAALSRRRRPRRPGRLAAARRRPRRPGAGLRADRRGGRPARRGRGLRRGAAGGRRADRAGPLAGHDPRLLPLAGGDARRARGGRRRRQPVARRARRAGNTGPGGQVPLRVFAQRAKPAGGFGLPGDLRGGTVRPWFPPQPRPASGTPSPTWAR